MERVPLLASRKEQLAANPFFGPEALVRPKFTTKCSQYQYSNLRCEEQKISFTKFQSSQADMCPKKATRKTVLQTWKAWKLYALFAATLLFATQCSWPYIYQIPPILRRSDWPVAEEIANRRRHTTKTLKYLSGTVF